MTNIQRAAQFAPFAALTGYDAAVQETARTTDRKKELSEEEKTLLNEKFLLMKSAVGSNIFFHFIYFVPDATKEGGAYVPYSGSIRKIDLDNGVIVLNDHTLIEIEQIVSIESDMFASYDF